MDKIKRIAISSLKHWREISFVYLIQLLVGLMVGLRFCATMCSSLDASMVLDQLAKGFDRTVMMDVLNSNDGLLDGVKSVVIPLLGIYLLISVFLQAGWLTNIKHKKHSIKSLLVSGLKYFLPFLGIALISLAMVIIFAVVIGGAFTYLAGDPLVTFSSEKPYVIWIIVLFCVSILGLIMVWSWSVSSRIHFIDGRRFFESLKLGFNSVISKWAKFLAVGLLVVGVHVILFFLYYWIMTDRGASSWFIVLFGILVQQIFAFSRVVLRGFAYSLAEDLQ